MPQCGPDTGDAGELAEILDSASQRLREAICRIPVFSIFLHTAGRSERRR